MSTSTVAPNTQTSVDVPFVPVNLAFSAVRYTDKAGKDAGKIEILTEDSAQKQVKEEKAEILWTQAGVAYKASSDSGVAALVPSEDERVVLFNRAAIAKQKQRFAAALGETDEEGKNFTWEPKAEALDLRELLAEESQRRNLSPIEKAERAIDAIPGLPEQIKNAMKAQLRGQQVAPVAA